MHSYLCELVRCINHHQFIYAVNHNVHCAKLEYASDFELNARHGSRRYTDSELASFNDYVCKYFNFVGPMLIYAYFRDVKAHMPYYVCASPESIYIYTYSSKGYVVEQSYFHIVYTPNNGPGCTPHVILTEPLKEYPNGIQFIIDELHKEEHELIVKDLGDQALKGLDRLAEKLHKEQVAEVFGKCPPSPIKEEPDDIHRLFTDLTVPAVDLVDLINPNVPFAASNVPDATPAKSLFQDLKAIFDDVATP